MVEVFNALATFVAAYIEDHSVYQHTVNDPECPWSIDYITKAFAFYMTLHDDCCASLYFQREGYVTSFKDGNLNQHLLLETICQDLREALESCQYMTLTH
jgi:hypothetical protein